MQAICWRSPLTIEPSGLAIIHLVSSYDPGRLNIVPLLMGTIDYTYCNEHIEFQITDKVMHHIWYLAWVSHI